MDPTVSPHNSHIQTRYHPLMGAQSTSLALVARGADHVRSWFTKRPASWTAAAVAALVFALSFGFNYGTGNQNTYLLGGLRLAHPELLTHDWLASQTTDYHYFFAYPVALLMQLDPSGWSFAAANVIMLTAGALIIFLLTGALAARSERVGVFLLVMLVCILTRTASAGGSYIYDNVFQPSTIGSTGLLLACYFFLRGRYLCSGLALAVGGLFHANYLLLGFPLFLVAHLFVSRERLVFRMAQQFVAPLVALAVWSPTLLSVVGGSGSAEGLDILLTFRAPHHYVPTSYWPEFLPLLAWLLVWTLAMPKKQVFARRLPPGTALIASLVVLVGVATILTTVVYVPRVAQLYVWRLCPFLMLLLQIQVLGAVTRELAAGQHDDPAMASKLQRIVVGGLAGILAVFYACYAQTARAALVAAVLLLALAGVLFACFVRERWARGAGRLSIALPLLMFTLVGALMLSGTAERSNLLRAPDKLDQTLYAWARTTDVDAVFMVPLDMEDFRLQAQRAIVVDMKSTPFEPSELEEWYSRVEALSGGSGEASGYGALSAVQLQTLAARYSVSYVVLEQDVASDAPSKWPVVFVNERYRVLRVTSELPAFGSGFATAIVYD